MVTEALFRVFSGLFNILQPVRGAASNRDVQVERGQSATVVEPHS
jgi:hypothetical protein